MAKLHWWPAAGQCAFAIGSGGARIGDHLPVLFLRVKIGFCVAKKLLRWGKALASSVRTWAYAATLSRCTRNRDDAISTRLCQAFLRPSWLLPVVFGCLRLSIPPRAHQSYSLQRRDRIDIFGCDFRDLGALEKLCDYIGTRQAWVQCVVSNVFWHCIQRSALYPHAPG